MKARFLAIASLLLTLAGCQASAPPPQQAPSADPRIEWLRQNAIPVRSISPDDEDFSDLQPLKGVLGDARVVLLGEQSHGDGATFHAKTRLVKFLHEEMGFDVLAFESGLYDCKKAWEALRSGEDPVTAVRRGVFGAWTRSAQVIPLLEYLGERAKSDRPLELAGFDCQFTGSSSRESLAGDLTAFLKKIGSPFLDSPDWAGFSTILNNLVTYAYLEGKAPKPGAGEQDRFLAQMGSLHQEAAAHAAKHPDPDTAFWAQMLESLGSQARWDWAWEDSEEVDTAPFRDSQMGDTLIWLANERYAGRRIVVWAATFHNARDLGVIDTTISPDTVEIQDLYREFSPMGEVAAATLGDQMYSLGFTAYEGEAGRPSAAEPHTLKKPADGSLEDLMHRAGLDNAIVDFRNPPSGGEWLRQPLVSRPFGYAEMKADWTRVLDGMMFMREMRRSTRAEK